MRLLSQKVFEMYHRSKYSQKSEVLQSSRIILQQCFESMEKVYLQSTSFQVGNHTLVDRFVSQLQNTDDRYTFQHSIGNIDQQLYQIFAADNYRKHQDLKDIYQKPSVPKNYSLTDSMLRSTLGCQQKLAKSYLQIVEQTQQKQSEEKQKRIQLAKKKFAQTNSHRDFCANTKPFMNNINFAIQRPVIDNEHDSYLKTQLIFLEQPRGSSLNTKEYFDKHTDLIAKKINQLGGMEDTIGRMEDTLSKNEVKSFKKKQILAQMNQSKKYLFSPEKSISRAESGKLRDSWINRSKQMRQSFMTKLQIQ